MNRSSRQLFAAACALALAFMLSANAAAQQQDAPKNTGDEKPAPGSTSDAWKQALPQSKATDEAQQGVGVGGAEESAGQIEKTIGALEQRWMEAVRLQDAATLKRLLAEDFTLAGGAGDGVPVDRTSYLDSVVRDWRLTSYSFDSMTVRVYGQTALVTAVYKQQATVDGRNSSGEFLTTDIWVKTGKRWRAVARHTSRLLQAGESNRL